MANAKLQEWHDVFSSLSTPKHVDPTHNDFKMPSMLRRCEIPGAESSLTKIECFDSLLVDVTSLEEVSGLPTTLES